MTTAGPTRGQDAGEGPAAAERRRRRAEVFGEVLPDATEDERDPGAGDTSDSDVWLRANVPPHHE